MGGQEPPSRKQGVSGAKVQGGTLFREKSVAKSSQAWSRVCDYNQRRGRAGLADDPL